MSGPLLVLDVSYLCHRALHTAGGLTWKGKATGVVFGFLKTIGDFKDRFDTDRVAFCFEHPHLFRRDIYPDYKKRRLQKRTPEEQKQRADLVRQIAALQLDLLPRIGFKNIFQQEGMESDDIMAALAKATSDIDETILVTADSDLLQCLRPNVSVFSPQKNKLWTESSFQKEHGFRPSKLAVVKAIAGCKSDNVAGILGVGEKSAMDYVRGTLKRRTALDKIASDDGRRRVLFNRQLVQLPYVGCQTPTVQDDQLSAKQWAQVALELGMRTLAGRPPIASRKAQRHG